MSNRTITPVAANLMKAKDLISDPKGWTQWAVQSTDEEGYTSYCAIGALRSVSGLTASLTNKSISLLGKVLLEDYDFRPVVGYYNDTHTHAEVMTLFDKAIERAIKEQV